VKRPHLPPQQDLRYLSPWLALAMSVTLALLTLLLTLLEQTGL
jgi:hypothetical protein